VLRPSCSESKKRDQSFSDAMNIEGSIAYIMICMFMISILHKSFAYEEYELDAKNNKLTIDLNVNININGSKTKEKPSEIDEGRGLMFKALTTNECSWSKWGQCSESCGNGFMERVRTNTAGKSGKDSCMGLPKETKRCQIRNNNCEPLPEPRYSLIADKGFCDHVSGKSVYQCSQYKVTSQKLCEDQCTSWTSCIAYNYNFNETSWCYLIPSERSCPLDFTAHYTGGVIAASMNELKADPSSRFVCYGKA